ncbi:RNA polymerase sigma factor [Propionicimonas paludicola]|nr:RNA polymerase sigma factor [Propionicimonas paludicola]
MSITTGSEPAERSDADLLAAAGRDDMLAYDELFRRHYRVVVAYALTISQGGSSDAEDAACEAMTLMWRKRRHIRLANQSVLPWLLVTTKNVARNIAKARAREQRRIRDAANLRLVAEPELEAAQREAAAFLDECIQRLSPMDRDVFIACVVEGRTYQEVATATSLTVPAVGNRLSRAKRQLREQLSANPD